MKMFEIDYETIDRITLGNLKEQRDTFSVLIKDHLEKGAYMHPDDFIYNKRLVDAMSVLIDYFGG